METRHPTINPANGPTSEVIENDLVELLHLSNSEFIAMSAGSTFSYWAGFLGNSLLIYHDYHPPCLIRDDKKIISFSEFVTKDPVF